MNEYKMDDSFILDVTQKRLTPVTGDIVLYAGRKHYVINTFDDGDGGGRITMKPLSRIKLFRWLQVLWLNKKTKTELI